MATAVSRPPLPGTAQKFGQIDYVRLLPYQVCAYVRWGIHAAWVCHFHPAYSHGCWQNCAIPNVTWCPRAAICVSSVLYRIFKVIKHGHTAIGMGVVAEQAYAGAFPEPASLAELRAYRLQ